MGQERCDSSVNQLIEKYEGIPDGVSEGKPRFATACMLSAFKDWVASEEVASGTTYEFNVEYM